MEKVTYLSTAETDYRAFLLLVENGHNDTALYGEDLDRIMSHAGATSHSATTT